MRQRQSPPETATAIGFCRWPVAVTDSIAASRQLLVPHPAFAGMKGFRNHGAMRCHPPFPTALEKYPVLRIATAEANPIVRTVLRRKNSVRQQRSAASSNVARVCLLTKAERTTLVASDSSTVSSLFGDRFFDTCCSAHRQKKTTRTKMVGWQSFCFRVAMCDKPLPRA